MTTGVMKCGQIHVEKTERKTDNGQHMKEDTDRQCVKLYEKGKRHISVGVVSSAVRTKLKDLST